MIKRICIYILLAVLVGISKVNAQTETVEIKTKIYCGHCSQCETCGKKFDTELYRLKGLKSFTINGNIIKVSFNPKKITVDKIRECIANCGYDADELKATEAGLAALDGCCRKQE